MKTGAKQFDLAYDIFMKANQGPGYTLYIMTGLRSPLNQILRTFLALLPLISRINNKLVRLALYKATLQ